MWNFWSSYPISRYKDHWAQSTKWVKNRSSSKTQTGSKMNHAKGSVQRKWLGCKFRLAVFGPGRQEVAGFYLFYIFNWDWETSSVSKQYYVAFEQFVFSLLLREWVSNCLECLCCLPGVRKSQLPNSGWCLHLESGGICECMMSNGSSHLRLSHVTPFSFWLLLATLILSYWKGGSKVFWINKNKMREYQRQMESMLFMCKKEKRQ